MPSDPSCHYGPTDLAAATGRSLTAEELHQLALETTQKVGNSTYWIDRLDQAQTREEVQKIIFEAALEALEEDPLTLGSVGQKMGLCLFF